MKKPRDKPIWKPNLDIQTENIRKPPLISSLELLILLYLPSSPGFVAHVPLPLLQLHCLQLLASLTDYRAGTLSHNKTPVRRASRHKYLSHQKPPKRLSCLTPNDEER